MMRAAVMREFGDTDIPRIEEVATPKPGPGNVLIKILAAGVPQKSASLIPAVFS